MISCISVRMTSDVVSLSRDFHQKFFYYIKMYDTVSHLVSTGDGCTVNNLKLNTYIKIGVTV